MSASSRGRRHASHTRRSLTTNCGHADDERDADLSVRPRMAQTRLLNASVVEECESMRTDRFPVSFFRSPSRSVFALVRVNFCFCSNHASLVDRRERFCRGVAMSPYRADEMQVTVFAAARIKQSRAVQRCRSLARPFSVTWS